jgi:voltage-gated potassium channel
VNGPDPLEVRLWSAGGSTSRGDADRPRKPRAARGPLDRLRRGLAILAVVFVGAVLGFRFVGGYDWFEAVWMVVITISSVGYGERSAASPAVQVLMICVILLGITSAAYVGGGLVQMLLEGELARVLEQRRTSRGIEELSEHVVVCGFGRIGQILAADLHQRRQAFVIIDIDAEKFAAAERRDYLFLTGDATEDAMLLAAGIKRAKTLVSVLPSDAANVFITLTARNLNPNLTIIARAEHRTTERKLIQAGANRVVLPAVIGARRVERLITRPSKADLVERVTESSFQDFQLDEFSVAERRRLAGVTVEATEAQRRHRLLVVAVRRSDGSMVFNPDANHTIQSGDVVIVMGRAEDIDRFRRETA